VAVQRLEVLAVAVAAEALQVRPPLAEVVHPRLALLLEAVAEVRTMAPQVLCQDNLVVKVVAALVVVQVIREATVLEIQAVLVAIQYRPL
jgi:hypothetical protein